MRNGLMGTHGTHIVSLCSSRYFSGFGFIFFFGVFLRKSTIHIGKDANSLVVGLTSTLRGFVHWSLAYCLSAPVAVKNYCQTFRFYNCKGFHRMENIWLGRKLLVSRWRKFLFVSRRSQEFFFTFFSFTAKTENQWEINFLFTFSVSSIMSAPRIPLRFYFCLIQETSTLLTILSELFSDFFLKCSHVKIGESKKYFLVFFSKNYSLLNQKSLSLDLAS
jgi:hypothetical protein